MSNKLALEELKKFANNCGIPNKGGVKSGLGRLALSETPQLKFESKYYNQVREALKTTIDKDKFHIFFRGLSLKESIKNLPPKGKYFTICVEVKNDIRLSQMCIANYSNIGL
jgi:hypothetical protein